MSECVENGEMEVLSKDNTSAGEICERKCSQEKDSLAGDVQDTKCNQEQETTKMNGVVGHDEVSKGSIESNQKAPESAHVNGGTEREASDTDVNMEEAEQDAAAEKPQNGDADTSKDSSQDKTDSSESQTKTDVQVAESKCDTQTSNTDSPKKDRDSSTADKKDDDSHVADKKEDDAFNVVDTKEDRDTNKTDSKDNSSSSKADTKDSSSSSKADTKDNSSSSKADTKDNSDTSKADIADSEKAADSDNNISSGESESSNKNELVGTVKDDDGEDILITLNEEEDMEKGEKETEDDNSEVKTESPKPEQIVTKSVDKDSKDKKVEIVQKTTASPVVKTVSQPAKQEVKSVQKATAVSPAVVSLPIVSLPQAGHQQSLIQPSSTAPVVQQGQQYGYVAKIGNQNVFVPISTPSISHPGLVTQLGQGAKQAGGSLLKKPPEDFEVKSSKDMINLMKWEIQNRIPDNYNWSVAFHPKKDELSSVTSFLLDLGHDVVKEAVYKDIIQIQTKKKDNSELKDNEIESLEKMKTVYDNTKKKVQHLQLPGKGCKGCNYKTESSVVMQHHLTFPHYDPWWDTSHGYMCCPRCSFRTKVILQFDIHMDTMHGVKARFPDKLNCFQCELCPLNTTTKNKLEKHRQKCIKHFKLNVNLQPYFHDVNFLMKNAFYKPKKVVVKPPTTVKPSVQTRSFPNQSPQLMLQQQHPKQALVQPVVSQRPPPLQQRPQHLTAMQGASRSPMVRPPNLQARPQMAQRPVRPQNKEMAGFEVCELCGGYVKDRQALRIHFYYAHKVEMPQAIFTRPQPPLNCDVCQSKFWTTQGLSKHKSTQRHFASSSSTTSQNAVNYNPGINQKCFMCMRKVPNLFIHIEQVHGMTMKELVAMKKCIMCGITASDRRQLEVHMATLHGVLIKANDFVDNTPSPALAAPVTAAPGVTTPAPPVKRGPPGMPMHQQSTVTSLQDKGVKPVGRLNLCVFCQIQFSDNIQLTMHCIKFHATCSGCGMVVATSKHLQGHSCKQVKRDCVICGAKNISPESFAEHMKKHVKPCKVKLDKLTEKEIWDVKDKIKREYKPQVISLDSDEDSEVEVVDTKPESTNVKDKAEKSKENTNESSETSKSQDKEKPESANESSETSKPQDKEKPESANESSETSKPQNREKPESANDKTVKEEDSQDTGEKSAEAESSSEKVEQVEPESNNTNGEVVNNGESASKKEENGQKRKLDEIEANDDDVDSKRRKDDKEESTNDDSSESDTGDNAQKVDKRVKRDGDTDESSETPAKHAKMDTSD